MKTPYYILVLVGYFCFGIGMLLGQALGAKPVIWIVTLILAGLGCIAVLVPFHRKPRKKKLPRRVGPYVRRR